LKEVMSELFPELVHLVPCKTNIDINKLGDSGQITSYTCNGAQKIQRILTKMIVGSYDRGCTHKNYSSFEKYVKKVPRGFSENKYHIGRGLRTPKCPRRKSKSVQ
jgi:hypothetical protein